MQDSIGDSKAEQAVRVTMAGRVTHIAESVIDCNLTRD
jgi:hypothetical protein